jgi:hypothetical protein
VLVIALFLGAAAGLAVAPSFGAALGIGAALFVGLVLAALKWREWLFSPSARILRGGIAVVIVALLGYLAWDGNPVRLQLTMDRLTPLPPRGVESAALFSRMATPRGGMAPFAAPKIVWRPLVRYMVAVSTQSVAQDTVRFILTHANPSPATPRTRAAEGGIHR